MTAGASVQNRQVRTWLLRPGRIVWAAFVVAWGHGISAMADGWHDLFGIAITVAGFWWAFRLRDEWHREQQQAEQA